LKAVSIGRGETNKFVEGLALLRRVEMVLIDLIESAAFLAALVTIRRISSDEEKFLTITGCIIWRLSVVGTLISGIA
jgi:hypothetical protein